MRAAKKKKRKWPIYFVDKTICAARNKKKEEINALFCQAVALFDLRGVHSIVEWLPPLPPPPASCWHFLKLLLWVQDDAEYSRNNIEIWSWTCDIWSFCLHPDRFSSAPKRFKISSHISLSLLGRTRCQCRRSKKSLKKANKYFLSNFCAQNLVKIQRRFF